MKKIIILILLINTLLIAQRYPDYIFSSGTRSNIWKIGLRGGAIKWENDSLLYKVLWNNMLDSAYFVLTKNPATYGNRPQDIQGRKSFNNITVDSLYFLPPQYWYAPNIILKQIGGYVWSLQTYNIDKPNFDTLATRYYIKKLANDSLAYLSKTNTFTGSNTFTNLSGITIGNNSTNIKGKIILHNGDALNPYTSTLQPASLTANQTYYLPNQSGTLALTSDIPTSTNFVTLDTPQSITGTKTFTRLNFSGSGILNLPTSDMIENSSIWQDGNVIKYRNASGSLYSLATLSDLNNYIAKPTNAYGVLKNDGTGIIYWQAILDTDIQTALGYTPTYIYDSGVSTSYTWSASKINTQLSYKAGLSDNNTFTGSNVFNGGVSFGTSGYFIVPETSSSLQGLLFRSGVTANLYFYRNTYGYERILLESDLSTLASINGNNTFTGSNTFNYGTTFNSGVTFGSGGYLVTPTTSTAVQGALFQSGVTANLYFWRNNVSYEKVTLESDLGNYFHRYNSNTIYGNNTYSGTATYSMSVGSSVDVVSSTITKSAVGADATIKAGKFVASVTSNDNTTAIGMYATASGGTNNYSGYFDNGILSTKNISYRGNNDVTTTSTIDAREKTYIKWNGTANTTVNTLSNGIDGQIIIITNNSIDYTLTIQDIYGNIESNGNCVLSIYDTIQLIYNSTYSKWLEISRSNN
ncbi:MAG: hypothetical protein AB1695_12450 [Stygiobacter sp.]